MYDLPSHLVPLGQLPVHGNLQVVSVLVLCRALEYE